MTSGLKIIKEIAIFVISLSLLPIFIVALLIWTDSQLYMHKILELVHRLPYIWFTIFLPYLGIQAIRAAMWSEKSLVGRKWANLYFALLAVCIGIWAFSSVWDLFYFMYALGDIPAELKQLIELEWNNILITVISILAAIYCFRIFLNPLRGYKPKNMP